MNPDKCTNAADIPDDDRATFVADNYAVLLKDREQRILRQTKELRRLNEQVTALRGMLRKERAERAIAPDTAQTTAERTESSR